jgi:hypothetical protein
MNDTITDNWREQPLEDVLTPGRLQRLRDHFPTRTLNTLGDLGALTPNRAKAKLARTTRVPIMLTEAEAQAIDNWRYSNRVPTRSDAIRRLCVMGMKTADEIDRAKERAMIETIESWSPEPDPEPTGWAPELLNGREGQAPADDQERSSDAVEGPGIRPRSSTH